MNIGAVIELEFGEVLDPEDRFNLISSNIAARVHEIPIFTKRIVRAPFDMTWPILVEDKNFDFTKHVLRVALPAPGTADQFDALISQFLSQPLSQRRPLWQLLVIEGLEDGRARSRSRFIMRSPTASRAPRHSPVSLISRPKCVRRRPRHRQLRQKLPLRVRGACFAWGSLDCDAIPSWRSRTFDRGSRDFMRLRARSYGSS